MSAALQIVMQVLLLQTFIYIGSEALGLESKISMEVIVVGVVGVRVVM